MVFSLSTNTLFMVSTSLKVRGALFSKPSAICPSMILFTKALILSSVCSFKLREAASTESAIISTAVSFEKGFGPG